MTIKDLTFTEFIPTGEIVAKVKELATTITQDYKDKNPLFIPVLNGSFIFAADLMREIDLECRVSFVKHASYDGTASTGKLKTLIGLSESIFGQDLVIIEDIMDSGLTLSKVVEELRSLGTKSVEIVTLVRKAKARKHAVQPKYVGFEIEDEFLVGYGLDYQGLGRHLKSLFRKV